MQAACNIEVVTSWPCMCPNQVKQAALGPRHADTANTLFHLAEVRSGRVEDMRLMHTLCLNTSSSTCTLALSGCEHCKLFALALLRQPAKVVVGALMLTK